MGLRQRLRRVARIAQVAREYPVRVDIEALADLARPAGEHRDGVFVCGIDTAEVLPAVDDVILRSLSVAFTQHHRAFVRPGLESQRHERELDAHQVDDGPLFAHAGALTAPHLESETRTIGLLEA